MKWIETLITHPGETLLFLFAILRGLVCNPVERVDCTNILSEMQTMNDSIILDYGDYDVMFPPDIYCEGNYFSNIFALPEKNAVGTNDIDNAVSILRFKDDGKLDRDVVKKNFLEMVSGPFEFRFLPIWSEEEIAYSQSKGFLLLNIPKKKVEIHTICPGIYQGEIGNVAILDKSTRTFVFEILESAGEDDRKVLRTIRFDNNTFTVLSEHPAGLKTSSYSAPWFTYNNNAFIYSDSTTAINAFDEKFQPIKHPLADAFNEHKNTFRCLKEIATHPTLPLALLIEQGKWPTKEQLSKFDSLSGSEWDKATDVLYDEANSLTLYLFRWTHPDPKQRLIPLLSSLGSIWGSYNPKNNYDTFTFSPDGKWVVFRDYTGTADNPVFTAVPISEKNPLLLGKPIKLGKVTRKGSTGPKGTAWTTGPTAFIMCDGAALYRWVLDDVAKMRHEAVPGGTPDPWGKTGSD